MDYMTRQASHYWQVHAARAHVRQIGWVRNLKTVWCGKVMRSVTPEILKKRGAKDDRVWRS